MRKRFDGEINGAGGECFGLRVNQNVKDVLSGCVRIGQRPCDSEGTWALDYSLQLS